MDGSTTDKESKSLVDETISLHPLWPVIITTSANIRTVTETPLHPTSTPGAVSEPTIGSAHQKSHRKSALEDRGRFLHRYCQFY